MAAAVIIVAATEFTAAEGDNLVRAIEGPVHTGSFQTSANHEFAPGLYHAG